MFKQLKPQSFKPILVLTLVAGVLFISLACSFGSSDSPQTVRIRRVLPHLTPTSIAMEPAAEVPVQAAAPSDTSPAVAQPAAAATPVQKGLPTLTSTPPSGPVVQMPVQQPQQPAAVAAVATDAPLPAPVLNDPVPVVIPVLPPNPNSPTELVPPVQNRPQPPTARNPAGSTPTHRPETPGWAFVGIQTSTVKEQTSVVGELVNNTGAPQQNVEVSGVFYDAQDQVLLDEIDTLSYVPIEIIPAGAHVPFELNIESAQPIYRLDLLAMSDRAVETPRQDFQIVNVTYWEDADGLYCLGGDIQNSGDSIQDYLVVLATAYDGLGGLVTFGEYAPAAPTEAETGQISPFEMCLDPLDQQVAHYELNAVGY